MSKSKSEYKLYRLLPDKGGVDPQGKRVAVLQVEMELHAKRANHVTVRQGEVFKTRYNLDHHLGTFLETVTMEEVKEERKQRFEHELQRRSAALKAVLNKRDDLKEELKKVEKEIVKVNGDYDVFFAKMVKEGFRKDKMVEKKKVEEKKEIKEVKKEEEKKKEVKEAKEDRKEDKKVKKEKKIEVEDEKKMKKEDEFGPLKGTKAWKKLSRSKKIKIGQKRSAKEKNKE